MSRRSVTTCLTLLAALLSGTSASAEPRLLRSLKAKIPHTLRPSTWKQAIARHRVAKLARNGAPARLRSRRDMLSVARLYRASFLFVGHGSKSQYKSMKDVQRALDPVVRQLNRKYGKGKWLAVFGGDPYDAKKPDIAHVMKYLQDRHKVPIMAAQSDIVDKQWGGVDKHIDYVRYVGTDYAAPSGAAKPSVLWGGFNKAGKPVGATKGYLDTRFISRALTGMIAVGGGPIALEEARYASRKGVPVKYVAAETRFPEVNGRFGSLHSWSRGLSE